MEENHCLPERLPVTINKLYVNNFSHTVYLTFFGNNGNSIIVI